MLKFFRFHPILKDFRQIFGQIFILDKWLCSYMEDGYKGRGWVKSGEVRDNNGRTRTVVVGAEIPSGAISNRM